MVLLHYLVQDVLYHCFIVLHHRADLQRLALYRLDYGQLCQIVLKGVLGFITGVSHGAFRDPAQASKWQQ